MKTLNPIRRRPQPAEEGFTLVAVVFLVALLTIAMAVAAPNIRKQLQRDREVETMHRGNQYKRAVKLYYKKFNAYPPNIDALVNTNNIHFLRRKYIDPTTGKDEWKIIRFGQNKVPTAWGFFGVPLGGSTIAGTGPNGGGSGLSGTPGSGGSNGGSFGAFGAFGSGGTSPGAPGSPSGSPVTDPNANNGTSGTPGAPGAPGGAGSTDPNAPGGSSSTGTGLTGQSFGGGGIIGFSPNSPKQSILTLHKKNHYNEWEFVYDPLAEQMMMQGGNPGMMPNGNPTTPGGGASGPFGGTSAPFGGSSPPSGGPTSSPGPAPTPVPPSSP